MRIRHLAPLALAALASSCHVPKVERPAHHAEAQASAPEQTVEPQYELIALEYASAPEMANTLSALIHDASGRDDKLRVIADSRTNALLVYGTPERIAQLKELIAQLDREVG